MVLLRVQLFRRHCVAPLSDTRSLAPCSRNLHLKLKSAEDGCTSRLCIEIRMNTVGAAAYLKALHTDMFVLKNRSLGGPRPASTPACMTKGDASPRAPSLRWAKAATPTPTSTHQMFTWYRNVSSSGLLPSQTLASSQEQQHYARFQGKG